MSILETSPNRPNLALVLRSSAQILFLKTSYMLGTLSTICY